MDAKEEFFNLISHNFTETQIKEVEALCTKLEQYIDTTNTTSLYYALSGLFFSSAKNYENFRFNAENYLQITYTQEALKYEIEQEIIWNTTYQKYWDMINNFWQKDTDFQKLTDTRPEKYEKEDILRAFCNAVFEELYEYDTLQDKLEEYEDYSQLADFLIACKNNNKKLIIDKFKIEYTLKTTNKLSVENKHITIKSPEVQNRLKNIIALNFKYNTPLFLNQKELIKKEEEYKERKQKHLHRIINRIIIITEYFNLNFDSELIKSSNNNLSYSNHFLEFVFHFIEALGVNTTIRNNKKLDSSCSRDELRTFISRRIQTGCNDTFTTKDINIYFPRDKFQFYSTL